MLGMKINTQFLNDFVGDDNVDKKFLDVMRTFLEQPFDDAVKLIAKWSKNDV